MRNKVSEGRVLAFVCVHVWLRNETETNGTRKKIERRTKKNES